MTDDPTGLPVPTDPDEFCPHCKQGVWKVKLEFEADQAGTRPELPPASWQYCVQCKAVLIGAHDLRLQHEGNHLIPLLIPYQRDKSGE